MARGKRPVSFRTRKLSLSAPMVLPWRRGGRVGRRRTYLQKRAPAIRLGPFSAFFRRFVATQRRGRGVLLLLRFFLRRLVEHLGVVVHPTCGVRVAQGRL